MLNFEALKFTLLIGSSFVDKLGFNYKTKTFAKTLHQVTKFVISLDTLCETLKKTLLIGVFVLKKKLGQTTKRRPPPERFAGRPNTTCR